MLVHSMARADAARTRSIKEGGCSREISPGGDGFETSSAERDVAHCRFQIGVVTNYDFSALMLKSSRGRQTCSSAPKAFGVVL